tara:strand:- start:1162 stop:2190 length:1029 start_codon:yes stop_codon:yes gene_type:complete
MIISSLKADSIIYYDDFYNLKSDNHLKEISNINYLGIYNDSLIIFEIQKFSKINFPEQIPKTSDIKLYSINVGAVKSILVNKKIISLSSIIYDNIDNDIFINYFETNLPKLNSKYKIESLVTNNSDKKNITKKDLAKIKQNKKSSAIKKEKANKKKVEPNNHFTIGYNIKQNLTIVNTAYNMNSHLTYGYIWLRNNDKNISKVDIGIEYSPKIFKSYQGYKFLKLSLVDIFFNLRFPPFPNSSQLFLKFGVSHILDFEIWGKDFKKEFNFGSSDKPNVGNLIGFGLLYKKIILTATKYNILLNGSHHITNNIPPYLVPPFTPGETITNPRFEILKMNLSLLF